MTGVRWTGVDRQQQAIAFLFLHPQIVYNFASPNRKTSGLAVLLFITLPKDAPWFTSQTANVMNHLKMIKYD